MNAVWRIQQTTVSCPKIFLYTNRSVTVNVFRTPLQWIMHLQFLAAGFGQTDHGCQMAVTQHVLFCRLYLLCPFVAHSEQAFWRTPRESLYADFRCPVNKNSKACGHFHFYLTKLNANLCKRKLDTCIDRQHIWLPQNFSLRWGIRWKRYGIDVTFHGWQTAWLFRHLSLWCISHCHYVLSQTSLNASCKQPPGNRHALA